MGLNYSDLLQKANKGVFKKTVIKKQPTLVVATPVSKCLVHSDISKLLRNRSRAMFFLPMSLMVPTQTVLFLSLTGNSSLPRRVRRIAVAFTV